MEIKIKNITIIVEGQEYSFTSKSLLANTVYDAQVDPEVQGTGLADIKQSNETPDNGGTPDIGAENLVPTEESASSDAETETVAEPTATPAIEPLAELVEITSPTE